MWGLFFWGGVSALITSKPQNQIQTQSAWLQKLPPARTSVSLITQANWLTIFHGTIIPGTRSPNAPLGPPDSPGWGFLSKTPFRTAFRGVQDGLEGSRPMSSAAFSPGCKRSPLSRHSPLSPPGARRRRTHRPPPPPRTQAVSEFSSVQLLAPTLGDQTALTG